MNVNNEFTRACKDGDLEKVKYLLTSIELTEHADIHARDECGFCFACDNGRLEVVKYLLASPDLTEHADIHAKDECGFRWACESGHLEVVKYLLTSPELKEHANIHALDDWVLATKETNSAIQWVRNWHQANIDEALLKRVVVVNGVSVKEKRI